MAHDAKQMAFREQRCKEEMFPKGNVGVMWVKTYGYIMRLKQGCWLHLIMCSKDMHIVIVPYTNHSGSATLKIFCGVKFIIENWNKVLGPLTQHPLYMMIDCI